jgi:acyl-CoA reductase-like NAD-dependent aldehyde dehydrogenase
MTTIQKTVSPLDGSLLAERPLADAGAIDAVLTRAEAAQESWRQTPLNERIKMLERMVGAFVANREAIAEEITRQMGRPLRYAGGEVDGFADRARTMLELAPAALADVTPPAQSGFDRYVQRQPLGLVLCLAPWNYPYLTAVNAIVPALAAGNVLVLKHSAQTPLCAERIQVAMADAGIPDGVFQIVHCSHAAVAEMVADQRVDFVAFTGSVEGGEAISRAAAGRFIGMGLELGGKDPAYVRADADLAHAVPNLVEGALFNSGQSCCGIERIYVHEDQFDAFVTAFVEEAKTYRLGDPREAATTLGPMVRSSAADHVRKQVAEAILAGALPLIDDAHFPGASAEGPYLAPQVLINVDHSMSIMTEETFGPVVGIMPVSDDAEAVRLMNDSAFGLTASVWSPDLDAARTIGEQLETGTVFANRCDYLDPQLAWAGVKNSGRGCTLSSIGYEHLTRPKSFHLRHL